MTNHIRFLTGSQPICEDPEGFMDEKDFISIDYNEGEFCSECRNLMDVWKYNHLYAKGHQGLGPIIHLPKRDHGVKYVPAERDSLKVQLMALWPVGLIVAVIICFLIAICI